MKRSLFQSVRSLRALGAVPMAFSLLVACAGETSEPGEGRTVRLQSTDAASPSCDHPIELCRETYPRQCGTYCPSDDGGDAGDGSDGVGQTPPSDEVEPPIGVDPSPGPCDFILVVDENGNAVETCAEPVAPAPGDCDEIIPFYAEDGTAVSGCVVAEPPPSGCGDGEPGHSEPGYPGDDAVEPPIGDGDDGQAPPSDGVIPLPG